MPKGKRKSIKSPPPQSYYKLSEVIQKIDSNQYIINPDVRRDAKKDFGWEASDIVKAFKILQAKHFIKSGVLKSNTTTVIDIYRGHINGENIYTHFYINDDFNKLVIDSFHAQQSDHT